MGKASGEEMKKFTALFLCGMFFCLPLLLGAFDKDKPAASTSLRASNPEMLANQSQLQTAIDNEHIFTGTSASTQTGDHTQGSARCFSQATAPATRIDGDGFLSTDLGSLWVDTDDNQLYILTATTPTWTQISTELYETFLANPRVFLDTLGVTGKLTALADAEVTTTLDVGTSLDIASTIAIVGTIDDDTMAAATDTNIATSESIVAYTDAAPAAQMTPSVYAGEESVTFPNGLILKQGHSSSNPTNNTIITFGTPFPNGITSAHPTGIDAATTRGSPPYLTSKSASAIRVNSGSSYTDGFDWQAWGY